MVCSDYGPCDPRIADMPPDYQIFWMQAHASTPKCQTCPHEFVFTHAGIEWDASGQHLAGMRLWWLVRAKLKGLRIAPVPDFDPQPHFWPAHRKPKVVRGESLIERIKSAWRIEDLADRLTNMRWRGEKGMGKCPFHQDRSPSFSVDITRQRWRCFAACGHGDVVDLYKLAKERGLVSG